jgi:hypothetical protein
MSDIGIEFEGVHVVCCRVDDARCPAILGFGVVSSGLDANAASEEFFFLGVEEEFCVAEGGKRRSDVSGCHLLNTIMIVLGVAIELNFEMSTNRHT